MRPAKVMTARKAEFKKREIKTSEVILLLLQFNYSQLAEGMKDMVLDVPVGPCKSPAYTLVEY